MSCTPPVSSLDGDPDPPAAPGLLRMAVAVFDTTIYSPFWGGGALFPSDDVSKDFLRGMTRPGGLRNQSRFGSGRVRGSIRNMTGRVKRRFSEKLTGRVGSGRAGSGGF